MRNLLNIPIHHYVRVTFWGFRGAVDRLGCVYVDVDRRYFNDNSPPNGGGGTYAVIDVAAGYQKLCGQDALSYVRYRHLDNDLVRAARQQDFLGEAKDQIGVNGVFSDRKELLRIFGVATDGHRLQVRDPLAAQARGRVGRQADPGGAVPRAGRRRQLGQRRHRRQILHQTVESFLAARASKGPRGVAKPTTAKRSKRTRSASPSPWPGWCATATRARTSPSPGGQARATSRSTTRR